MLLTNGNSTLLVLLVAPLAYYPSTQTAYTVTRYTPAGATDRLRDPIDCQYLATCSSCWHYREASRRQRCADHPQDWKILYLSIYRSQMLASLYDKNLTYEPNTIDLELT